MGKGVKMVPKGPMEEYCEIRKLSISGDSRLFLFELKLLRYLILTNRTEWTLNYYISAIFKK